MASINLIEAFQDFKEAENIDRERYQTVFAKIQGAVAAPTASLHSTDELLKKIDVNRQLKFSDVRNYIPHIRYFYINNKDIIDKKNNLLKIKD